MAERKNIARWLLEGHFQMMTNIAHIPRDRNQRELMDGKKWNEICKIFGKKFTSLKKCHTSDCLTVRILRLQCSQTKSQPTNERTNGQTLNIGLYAARDAYVDCWIRKYKFHTCVMFLGVCFQRQNLLKRECLMLMPWKSPIFFFSFSKSTKTLMRLKN